ncbi:hypothetical protein PQ459_18220 [Chryseobacterium sp. KACC 21268]|nr:hypothetical protein PQ459_18220 [Chryseobacterium sp. KACC 21268]
MLSILLTILILLGVNFGNGIIIKRILKFENQSFVLISFLGIVGITLLETLAAFFAPLNSFLEFLFILTGLAGVGWYWSRGNLSQINYQFSYWFYFFFLIIIFSASFSPYLFDHYGYYVPTVSYLKQVGFVKGISNFDLLLGQTSFWHIYQAGFSHFIDPFFKINSYLSVLFLIYIYERKQYFLLIFIPIFLLFVQQPSPDLPVLIITLIVINELIHKKENSILLYLSLFAVCIKPIVFWLPLLVIFQSAHQRKFNFKVVVPIFIFAGLSIAKNLWLFGFPLFPVSLIDFNLPWKPSQQMITYSSQIGLMKSYDMKYTYQQISQFDFFDRIFHWFTIGYKSVFNIGIIVSLLIVGIFVFKKKSRFYYLLLIFLIVKSVVIFTISAQYRFFIDVYVIAIFILVKYISEKKLLFFTVFLSLFVSVIFIFPRMIQKFNIGNRMSDFSWSQLYKPAQYNSVKISKNYTIGNLNFNSSKKIEHKDHFPSLNLYDLKLYDYYGIFPQYLVKDYKSGFFQRKLTAAEKIQLKKIIAETQKLNP